MIVGFIVTWARTVCDRFWVSVVIYFRCLLLFYIVFCVFLRAGLMSGSNSQHSLLFLFLPEPFPARPRCAIEHHMLRSWHQTHALRSMSPYVSMIRRRHVFFHLMQVVHALSNAQALHQLVLTLESASEALRYATKMLDPSMLYRI